MANLQVTGLAHMSKNKFLMLLAVNICRVWSTHRVLGHQGQHKRHIAKTLMVFARGIRLHTGMFTKSDIPVLFPNIAVPVYEKLVGKTCYQLPSVTQSFRSTIFPAQVGP